MPVTYIAVNQRQLVVERWQDLITAEEHRAHRQRPQADSTIAAQAARLDALDDDGRRGATGRRLLDKLMD